MPLENLELEPLYGWGLWKITESEETLVKLVKGTESIPPQITHPQKRLEFITGRLLAKLLLEKTGGLFRGVEKDEFGKPFYVGSTRQLALSHSYPYVAALTHASISAGIDVEQIKSKLVRIAPRILHASELTHAGEDEVKLCVYWCAKETLVKVYGKKDLTFSQQLIISPFQLEKQGALTGTITANGKETTVSLQYRVFDDFVLVYNI